MPLVDPRRYIGGERRRFGQPDRHKSRRRCRNQPALTDLTPPIVQQAWVNVMPGRNSLTRAPRSCVSPTIRSFSSEPQRRRRSRPVMISTTPFDIALNSTLHCAFKVTTSAHTPDVGSKAAHTGRNHVRITEIKRSEMLCAQ